MGLVYKKEEPIEKKLVENMNSEERAKEEADNQKAEEDAAALLRQTDFTELKEDQWLL